MPDSGNSREFLGFPIPASAAMVASLTMFLVWLEEKNLPTSSWRWVLLAVLVFLSVMMVSEVKYPSFKKLDFRSRRPFTKFVAAVVVVACFRFFVEIPRADRATADLHVVSGLRLCATPVVTEVEEGN